MPLKCAYWAHNIKKAIKKDDNQISRIFNNAIDIISNNKPQKKDAIKTINAIISASQNDEIKLLKDLRSKVPSYMIPDKVYYYETIPKNNNGKIKGK